MSHSRKKNNIVQDNKDKSYWKKIRRVIKHKISSYKNFEEEVELPNPKEIVNDYDFRDWKFFCDDEKYKRK